MTLNEIQSLLTHLMRGIDRKTSLTVEPTRTTDRPGVTVRLSRDRHAGALELSEADLLGSQSDLIKRNQVRTALKRARDRMWEHPGYIFSTKFEPTKGDWMGFTRRPQGGGGRGRR